jgi:hypothetical protein
MGGQVVEDDVDFSTIMGGDHLIHKLEKFRGATASKTAAHDFAGGGVQRREEVRSPMTGVVMSAFSVFENVIGNSGCVRSSAWICVFSSIDSTTASIGGSR